MNSKKFLVVVILFVGYEVTVSSAQSDYFEIYEKIDFNYGLYLSFEQLKSNQPYIFIQNDTTTKNLSALSLQGDTIVYDVRDIYAIVSKNKLNLYFQATWYDLNAKDWDDYFVAPNIEALSPLYKKPELKGYTDYYEAIITGGMLGIALVPLTTSQKPSEADLKKVEEETEIDFTKRTPKYLLDFKTGRVHHYNTPSIEYLLKKDPELFKQYKRSKLSKDNKIEQFIENYNRSHPLYFNENGQVISN